MSKPVINVTPLIDVLLVLLIIFMVVSPLKPTDFKARIPREPDTDSRAAEPNPYTLIVALNSDSSLKLNGAGDLGTADNAEKLTAKLQQTFQYRIENRAYSEKAMLDSSLPEAERIERTVFIKAPKNTDYGKVVKVIDAVKLSGANPISLQIDDLEN